MSEETPEKEVKKAKEFGLSSLSVNNRTTVFVLTFIILILGWTSYTSMPKENFPEVVTPEIYVGTPYPGNSPLDIEKEITRPLEKEINTITGVDEINSTSVEGFSSIQVKFDFSVDPTDALRKVKDAVDIAKSDAEFPKDLPADPNIFEMNFSELIPIMNINLSGDYSLERLKEYGEYLEDQIEDLPQISKVDIRGVSEKEVKIELDLPKMEYAKVSYDDVERSIQGANVTMSGGSILLDGVRRNVRVAGEFQSLNEIENLIVKQEKFNIVYLKDIARVFFQEKEPDSYARENEQTVVMLDVIKRAGENLLEVSDAINEIVETSKKSYFPADLEITITNDQSDQTRTQVGELENSIIFGVLLVVLVLLFFLGLRNALFVGVAIPLSMLTSFVILSALGVTLNVMVLFSLVLALGMLVDNGIVVVENIYRLMDEGLDPITAAKQGVGEVAWPIIASTATTLGAFLPLAIWPGLMGEFMKYLPMTLIIVLSSSLFVALVINPVLTAVFMKVGESKPNKKRTVRWSLALVAIGIAIDFTGSFTLGNLIAVAGLLGIVNLFVLLPGTKAFQGKVIPALENGYEKFLRWALKGARPKVLFASMFGLLFVAFFLMSAFPPKVLFFPENEPLYVNVFIEMPVGTDIEKTNAITKKLEKKVLKAVSKYDVVKRTQDGQDTTNWLVTSVIAQVGNGTSDPNAGPSLSNTPHKGRISVSFVEYQKRGDPKTGDFRLTSDVMEEIREAVKGLPGVRVTVDKNEAGPPQGKPINIEITGDDYNKLLAEANAVKAFIEQSNIPGIEELILDVDQGKPELPIIIDQAKAKRFNLSTFQIAAAIRTALFGKEVSSYKLGEDDYEINLRLSDENRFDVEKLLNQRITFRDQMTGAIRQVPISAVASFEKSSTFSAVKRQDLNRVVTVQSNVLGDYNANEVVQSIKDALKNYELDREFTLAFTGQQEEQAKEMAFLSQALLIALFLIFLIIVSQFNSASTPFIIMLAVFFSLIGVLFGLVLTGMEFVIIMTMIGIISLAGVVVNNAIVLIDYTNLVRDRRKEELKLGEHDLLPIDEVLYCVISGGKTRLRPVLLTAITTILGLLPLAIGLNINFATLFSEFDPNIYIGGDNVIFWGPMSWTIIFGLTFATFLTLVMVPVMYSLIVRAKIRFSRSLVRWGVLSKPLRY